MILREATIKYAGYDPDDLKSKSSKRICCVCNNCGRIRWLSKSNYRDLCHFCSVNTNNFKKAARERQLGRKASNKKRKKISKSQKKRWEDPLERKKIIKGQKKYYSDPIAREKLSALQQGIPYDEWESFALEQKYCPAFNEECKESNRDKYGRKCFLTGLPESENITSTGKQQKLSVHHVDMDKWQGCDGKRWKLIPLCLKWHARIHTKLWEARIMWLLNNVWKNIN